MRISILLALTLSTVCFSQTDSMFVEKMDGTIPGYSVSEIIQIEFRYDPRDPVGIEREIIGKILSSFSLHQNYPNPFNPSTTIQYNVPTSGDVEVNIFDIQGRLVRSLSRSYQQVGTHSIVWDSRNNDGSTVASGAYLCQVIFDGSALVKKLLLIK